MVALFAPVPNFPDASALKGEIGCELTVRLCVFGGFSLFALFCFCPPERQDVTEGRLMLLAGLANVNT